MGPPSKQELFSCVLCMGSACWTPEVGVRCAINLLQVCAKGLLVRAEQEA